MSVYHSGEKEVQVRAGVREMSERIGNSIGSNIPAAAQEFLLRRPFAVFGSVDAQGFVWASVLTAHPGFLQATNDRTVRINAAPIAGDPLKENLKQLAQVGMLVIEFSKRQRMRINGRVVMEADGSWNVTADQVYSNCPKYIQARDWAESRPSTPGSPKKTDDLTLDQQQLIARADTFFIASSHPDAGVDVSHRGGNPGFIRVSDSRNLSWPDYAGNMMFQTLGNITAYPNAGLLFFDFENGNTVQITGKARIHWSEQRGVEFAVESVIEIPGVIPVRWKFFGYSPHNPEV